MTHQLLAERAGSRHHYSARLVVVLESWTVLPQEESSRTRRLSACSLDETRTNTLLTLDTVEMLSLKKLRVALARPWHDAPYAV